MDAFLPTEQSKGEVSLARVLLPHTIENAEPLADLTRAAELAVTEYHSALVQAEPELHVSEHEGGTLYDVRLDFASPLPDAPGQTTARLLSRNSDQHAQSVASHPVWRGLALAELTPFVVIRTAVDVQGVAHPLVVDCVVKARLVGAPEDRPAHILRSLLDSETSVLRYLSFLLDESGADAWGLGIGRDVDQQANPGPSRPTFDDLAMLETLVRAAARGDESLTRVHALLEDLRDEAGHSPVVSKDFLSVWHAVWEATGGDERG